ncbi:Lichenan permease IIC component [Vibrio aerogenes CECT 7868]|uniref:Permease IIC component n=1 Tax=Vibrio aerogenes CECT 7868 TaxID=1216006 RepID=A0A1M5V4V0_9VIBR|nr:PTS sugar transporter subunit IIC [Vibrio aerogenes]SHH70279.1 Lichenan permease IIC component [Vibrio aerogenes CECT 7868]
MFKVLFDFLENTLTPVAGKLATQKHVSAIRDGFIGAMPFMIVGSFLLVFAYPPFSADTSFALGQWWLNASKAYADEIITPFSMSMGIMSCYISACIAYNLAQSYKLDVMPTAMLSLMTFLLVAAPMKDGHLPASHLGGTGIFTAIIVAIFVTELTRFLKERNIGFTLPEQVPEKIRQSFNLLIPAMIVILTIYPLNLYVYHHFNMLLPGAIMALFQPLISASDTLPALLIAVLVMHVLWFAGIHGAAIVGGIMSPFWLYNLGLNQEALAAGTALPHIFMEPFLSFFVLLGGSGATFALVLMYIRSRSAHLNMIGKISLVPAVFNINEPVIFGSPIVMNPIMFIPFVGAPLINATIAYFASSMDWVGKIVSLVPGTAPAPIGASWAAGWQLNNVLLVFVLFGISFIIYYPFFKIYEKQLVTEEVNEAKSAHGEPVDETHYA